MVAAGSERLQQARQQGFCCCRFCIIAQHRHTCAQNEPIAASAVGGCTPPAHSASLAQQAAHPHKHKRPWAPHRLHRMLQAHLSAPVSSPHCPLHHQGCMPGSPPPGGRGELLGPTLHKGVWVVGYASKGAVMTPARAGFFRGSMCCLVVAGGGMSAAARVRPAQGPAVWVLKQQLPASHATRRWFVCLLFQPSRSVGSLLLALSGSEQHKRRWLSSCCVSSSLSDKSIKVPPAVCLVPVQCWSCQSVQRRSPSGVLLPRCVEKLLLQQVRRGVARDLGLGDGDRGA